MTDESPRTGADLMNLLDDPDPVKVRALIESVEQEYEQARTLAVMYGKPYRVKEIRQYTRGPGQQWTQWHDEVDPARPQYAGLTRTILAVYVDPPGPGDTLDGHVGYLISGRWAGYYDQRWVDEGTHWSAVLDTHETSNNYFPARADRHESVIDLYATYLRDGHAPTRRKLRQVLTVPEEK